MIVDRSPVVHVIGEYFPMSSGPDERSAEKRQFNRLFEQSNAAAGGTTVFLKKRSSDLTFGEPYISRCMKLGDVVVYLNPVRDLSMLSARRRYRDLMQLAARAVGHGRSVLAMQDADLGSRIKDGQLPLLEIDYSPIYGLSGRGVETVVLPAPEEAFSIVKRLLLGERPAVFA